MTDLFAKCPNEKCVPIRLHVSNPERIAHDPTLWPTDGKPLFLECPSCKLVSAHFRADVLDAPEVPHSKQMVWLRVSFRCSTIDCGLPVEFHVYREIEVLRLIEFG